MGLMDDGQIVMVCRYADNRTSVSITRTYWTPTLMSRCLLYMLCAMRGLMYCAVVENCFKGFSGDKKQQEVGQNVTRKCEQITPHCLQ